MSHKDALNYQTSDDVTYDVLGIGNPIVDVLARVDEAFLSNEDLPKGMMTLVDATRAAALAAKLENCTECSGGSVANTVAAMAQLGAKVAFMGRVFDDRDGRIFREDLRAEGVAFDTEAAKEGLKTAKCLVCVTPDGERTMSTFLGACGEFASENVCKQRVAESGIVYIEGYLWDQDKAKDAIRTATHTAKRVGRKVALTLSDPFCVERHRDSFLELIHSSVDILLANEQEATSLVQENNLEDAIRHIASMVELAAVTCSEGGVWIAHQGAVTHVPTQPVTKVVDTTGAGDLFAAGFLAGLTQGKTPEQSAQMGHRLAGEIIQQMGARSLKDLKGLVA